MRNLSSPICGWNPNWYLPVHQPARKDRFVCLKTPPSVLLIQILVSGLPDFILLVFSLLGFSESFCPAGSFPVSPKHSLNFLVLAVGNPQVDPKVGNFPHCSDNGFMCAYEI